METVLKDIRYGVRSLLKRPAFTIVAVITLGLGIGVNTAIFSVINAVLLRPLPYSDPARIVTFRSNQSAPDLIDVEAQSKTITKFGGLVAQPLDYTGGAEPIQFQIGQVTGGFFETLGVKAERGRFISPDDDKNGAPYVVVLSHSLWLKQFNGDLQIVGKTIPLSPGATGDESRSVGSAQVRIVRTTCVSGWLLFHHARVSWATRSRRWF